MYLIGLTGGIASGKSVVGKRLAELGAIHVDADLLAREVVEPGTPGLAHIAAEFGPSVIAADGSLDRGALGAMIFPDPEKRAALNAITHPAVWARAHELFERAERDDPGAVIVYDVPLLVEASADRQMSFDLVVVVHADLDTRIGRLMQLRGMTREEATHRVNSQATDTERLAIADVVIDSNGTLEHTIEQADELWAMARASAISKQPG
ncbi:MAG: dephospho-CoA kinase [Rhodoglobus sp.]|nr:dephospho-CoA kinase [Rhodoglobus sp.]